MVLYTYESHVILMVWGGGKVEYILIGASGICGVTDIISRRVPNIVTFPLILISVIYHIYKGTLLLSLSGFFLAFLIGFVGFVLGQLGAGDVKLMAGIGAGLGARALAEVLFYAAVAGLTYAFVNFIITSIKERKLGDRVIRAKITLLNHSILGAEAIKDFLGRENKYPVPFGACLFIGMVLSIIL